VAVDDIEEPTCAISLLDHHQQAAIVALFRVVNRYVGNLAPMPGVLPDYKAPIVRIGVCSCTALPLAGAMRWQSKRASPKAARSVKAWR
jgi:hypothetical protein